MSATQLPFLPGYNSTSKKAPRYPRPHTLELINGVRVDNVREQQEKSHSHSSSANELNPLAVSSSFSSLPEDLETTALAASKAPFVGSSSSFSPSSSGSLKGSSSLSAPPSWLANNRQVLRFFCYFLESVFSSPQENWRLRKCVLFFYLEDETAEIVEPRVENSGIVQGSFVKRHRMRKGTKSEELALASSPSSLSSSFSFSSSSSFLTPKDLFLGAEVLLYGRVFKFVDCDQFTRQFYLEKMGKQLGKALDYPVDSFSHVCSSTGAFSSSLSPSSFSSSFSSSASLLPAPLRHHKLMHPHKEYMEATLGKALHRGIPQTQQFLAHDGQVLRFFCRWRDLSPFGEIRPYVLHFYLADDTVEVLEIQQPNSGRDPFPTLLKRQKLAKNWVENTADLANIGQGRREGREEKEAFSATSSSSSSFSPSSSSSSFSFPSSSSSSSPFYTEKDLRVGQTIDVFGRPLFLCGADEFTKRFYMEKYGLKEADFPSFSLEEEEEQRPKVSPPPHNGFGSEEDSLGSFLFLIPKVPKPDFQKMFENDGKMLRFLGELAFPSAADRGRKFIITFYLATDQVSIFEKFERNSGFIGGKFLERQKLKNPKNGEYFVPSDFFVGAVLNLNGHKMRLNETDEYTRKFMENNQHLWM